MADPALHVATALSPFEFEHVTFWPGKEEQLPPETDTLAVLPSLHFIPDPAASAGSGDQSTVSANSAADAGRMKRNMGRPSPGWWSPPVESILPGSVLGEANATIGLSER